MLVQFGNNGSVLSSGPINYLPRRGLQLCPEGTPISSQANASGALQKVFVNCPLARGCDNVSFRVVSKTFASETNDTAILIMVRPIPWKVFFFSKKKMIL